MAELFVEFLVEFVFQFLAEIVVDLIVHSASRTPWIRRTATWLLTAILYFGVGLLIGWLSLWFFPRAFVRSATLPGISLLITPVLCGLGMGMIGTVRKRRGKAVVHLESFSHGFLLALGMTLIRFLFAR